MSLTVNAETNRIVITRGDDQTIRFTVKNSAGVAYDVSSNSFKFTLRALTTLSARHKRDLVN